MKRKNIILLLISVLLVSVIGNVIWKIKISKEDVENSFVLLSEDFTDKKIVDESSALEAIEDVAKILRLGNAKQELNSSQIDTVFGHTYYRFQQTYKGYPVYGRTVTVSADEDGNALLLAGNISEVSALPLEGQKITFKEAVRSAEDYIATHFDIPDRRQIEIISIGSDELVIYPENDMFKLSYVISAYFYSEDDPGHYELVVSAENGEVLRINRLLYEAVGYMDSDISRKNGFPIFESEEGYYLWDTEDDFYVFNFNNRKSKDILKNTWGMELKDENNNPRWVSYWNEGEFVVSDNVIFGDTDLEKEKDFEAGARLLIHTKKVADFFEDLGFQRNSRVYLYYQDGYDNGENARGGMYSGTGIVSMGTKIGVDAIDILAHEYTHYVSLNIVGWNGGNETDSINEAISDIFGVLIEAHIKEEEIDWEMGKLRNLKYPDGDCIWNYADYTDELDEYSASTLISHAAYLMWNGIDGNGFFEALNEKELASLFFETLYVLPPDCTLNQFRTLVQNVAEYQNLSIAQKNCVSNAFFQTGLSLTAFPVEKDGLSIDLYGTGGVSYEDFTLLVRQGGYEKEYSGKSIYMEKIVFPEEGECQLYFTDNVNLNNQITVNILVVGQGGSDRMPLFTSFGTEEAEGPITALTTEMLSSEEDVGMVEDGLSREVSLYFENYEQLVEELDMKPTDYWQFPDSNSYIKNQFYLEWINDLFSMKNEGNSNIKLYGCNLGNDIGQVQRAFQQNGWTKYYNTRDRSVYIAIINKRDYIVELYMDENGKLDSWYLNNWPEGEGMAEAFLQLEKNQIEKLSSEQLEYIRKALNIPDNLPVEVRQSEAYYWEGAGCWIIPVNFYYQGQMIAGVNADAYTGEPLANFFLYDSDFLLPQDETEPMYRVMYSDDELCEMAREYYAARNTYVPPFIQVEEINGDMVRIQIYESMGDHTTTYDWYTVNRYTAEGEDVSGNVIDLKNP